MKQEAYLLELVEQVRQLVDGEAACFVIGSSLLELQHPLLDLFPSNSWPSIRCYGATELAVLLEDEGVRALLDLAAQTGRAGSNSRCRISISSIEVHSLAVVPVERPAGLLGFFLIANPLLEGFCQGELRLLNDYCLSIAPALELAIRDLCSEFLYARLVTEDALNHSLQSTSANNGPAHLSQQSEFVSVEGEFVSMVSHELRAPLTAIKGYAGLLQAYAVPTPLDAQGAVEMTPARQQHYLRVIMQQVDHLEVVTADLLDISRIESGRLALRFCEVNIVQLCQRVTRLMQDRVNQQQPGKYRIQCKLDADLPCVWADSDRVEQVLHNLLENAIKYSPDGGLIEVLARIKYGLRHAQGHLLPATKPRALLADPREAPTMHITVRDYGIGIALQQRSQLFKPYSRLAHSPTMDIPGIGLGLYITSRFVEAMHGEIMLVSREGEGTSISFTLPLAETNKKPFARASRRPTLQPDFITVAQMNKV
ncbi:MAG TPA: HAMP domain-containing sensor histidine kinase [Ktedonobacteraceae bacterium]|nr:HAMP domain-containing sensor histidine kinase [Ktedonobacteraceae bacterium]